MRRSTQRLVTAMAVSVMAVATLFALLALAACGGETPGTVSTDVPVASTTSTETAAPTTTDSTSAPALDPGAAGAPTTEVSEEALAYAAELGGTSQEGESLHLIIGASVSSEAEAQRLLGEALPRFGDMQSYFIVQRSDGFDGLEPGWWIVMEAHLDDPAADSLEFARRGFPDAHVMPVTVLTSDPIPVYDDMIEASDATLIYDAIARSDAVPADFELYSHLISEDGAWAGARIGTPEQGNYYALLANDELKGWYVVQVDTYLLEHEILAHGAPEEIAAFLDCYT